MANIVMTSTKFIPACPGVRATGIKWAKVSSLIPLPAQQNINQVRAMVKQYSFFNSLLQMEAPELVPTPTPTPHPGAPQM